MMRLPEGVEGVFEPSMGGTRLQGGQSVSWVSACTAHRAPPSQARTRLWCPNVWGAAGDGGDEPDESGWS